MEVLMNEIINFQRRKLLKMAGIGATALTLFPSLLTAKTKSKNNQASLDFNADVEIRLTEEAIKLPIFSGPKTTVWKVRGEVLKGDPSVITNDNDSYLAPTIRLSKGQKVRIYLKNNLSANSILHWHGLHVPSKMDGNPMYAIGAGESFVYEFEVLNRAGTYWYHAHTHSVTARQVYSGLAGLFIVSDAEEQALDLPSGQFDVPIVIQDRSFDSRNQLQYISHMMQRMQGFLGDQIMINGRPDFSLDVSTRAYRLRLLNGSNSRIYKLAWDDGTPIKVIATDGGLLERPETVPYLMLAPAERREIWVDFSSQKVGTELTLRSTEFSTGGHGMGMMGGMGRMGGGMGGRGGMMGGSNSSLPSGGDYPVLKVRVNKKSSHKDKLPRRLSKITPLKVADAANKNSPRRITLSMRHMSALLNGRSYQMNDIREDEIIPVNTLQLMEFDNGYHGGGMGMPMPHPMHLHGEQFQVIKREYSGSSASYNSVKKGLVDSGWKDTVLVMPGEKVTFLKPFNDFTGIFMYHCHNLEHEDMGMMRDFLVK